MACHGTTNTCTCNYIEEKCLEESNLLHSCFYYKVNDYPKNDANLFYSALLILIFKYFPSWNSLGLLVCYRGHFSV